MNINNVIIGTSNYENCKSLNTVSITGDGGNAWGYFGASYKKLAPRLVTYQRYEKRLKNLKNISDINEYNEYKKILEDEYIESYFNTRLKDLDVYELLNELYNKFGSNIILLCHEPVLEFCHRRLVADFIELKTGFYIPEIVEKNSKIKRIQPIRYKNRLKKYI